MTQLQYPFYPNLVRQAIRDGSYESGLRYWLYLHSFSGYCEEFIPANTIACFNDFFSTRRSQAHKVLSGCNGRLWDYTRGESKANTGLLRVYNPEEVADAYGIDGSGPRWYLHASDICGQDHQARMFLLLAKHFCSHLYSPITREEICKLTGVKFRTQRNHIKTLNLKMTPNFVLEQVFATVGEARRELHDSGAIIGHKRAATLCIQTPQANTVVIPGIYSQIGSSFEFTHYYSSGKSSIVYLGKADCGEIWCSRELSIQLPPHESTYIRERAA